jgi:hypothetical protein
MLFISTHQFLNKPMTKDNFKFPTLNGASAIFNKFIPNWIPNMEYNRLK